MNTENLESIITRYTEITEQIAALTEEKQGLTALLLSEIEPETKLEIGDYRVSVGKITERLNTRRLTEALPVSEHPALYKATIDTAAVKKHVPYVNLKALGVYDTSTPRITIQ